ncbi:hypothetical protein GF340_04105 [Candidatus Peregrinibacteria bacterium]|nr:hypothetical protein [Candidatus Peregrinibacteria bacterium]
MKNLSLLQLHEKQEQIGKKATLVSSDPNIPVDEKVDMIRSLKKELILVGEETLLRMKNIAAKA